MMPIILTPLRKGLRVAILRGRTEHSRIGVIAGDAVPGAVRALHAAFELSGTGTIRPERPFGEFV